MAIRTLVLASMVCLIGATCVAHAAHCSDHGQWFGVRVQAGAERCVILAATFGCAGRDKDPVARAVGTNRKDYAGYEFDPIAADSNLHVRHRVLKSDLGRWSSRDPVEYASGHNLALYTHDNPIKRTDPTGLFSPGFWSFKLQCQCNSWLKSIIDTNPCLSELRDNTIGCGCTPNVRCCSGASCIENDGYFLKDGNNCGTVCVCPSAFDQPVPHLLHELQHAYYYCNRQVNGWSPHAEACTGGGFNPNPSCRCLCEEINLAENDGNGWPPSGMPTEQKCHKICEGYTSQCQFANSTECEMMCTALYAQSSCLQIRPTNMQASCYSLP